MFPLRKGSTTNFKIAKHEEISWSHANLEVQIGPIVKTHIEEVDEFNEFVLKVFNTASGNMLKEGNILSWNVWFTAPELVDQEEWRNHAIKWRDSIDADHGSPEGPGGDAHYFDGKPFKPLKELFDEELKDILKYLTKKLLD